jgi:hypothetical protein
MSMLIGLFWEVEHSALYKPIPKLKGIDREPEMRQRRSDVYDRLTAFEGEFERLVRAQALRTKKKKRKRRKRKRQV